MELNKIYEGDCLGVLKTLPDNSIDCCVTSPPYYGLRDYGNDGQIGLEETPEKYVLKMVQVFSEVKRVLKNEGTLWLNLGDTYATGSGGGNGAGAKQHTNFGSLTPRGRTAGYKSKDLIGIPWMVAFALRSSGWYLRQDIIWHKPNPMPESVTDRCTKSHEYIFLMSKSAKYYYDNVAIEEVANYDGRKDIVMKGSEKYANGYFPNDKNTQSIAKVGHERWKFKSKSTFGNRDGELDKLHSGKEWQPKVNDEMVAVRNKRSVWTVNTMPYSEAHFATFPERLIVDCIKAGCPENGTVLDPFSGAGTTALVARKLNRNYIGIELNPEYIKIAEKRLEEQLGMFA